MFWPTSRLKQYWDVPCHSTSGVTIGKCPRHLAHSVGETSRLQFRVPSYNPRKGANWYHHQSVTKLCLWSLWYKYNVFVSICDQMVSCSCCVFWLVKLGMLLNSGLGWPGPLQGLNNFKLPPHLTYGGASPAFRAGSHLQSLPVRAVSRQLRSKVSGLLCFVSEA